MGQENPQVIVLPDNPIFSRPILLVEDCEGTFNWTAAGSGADYEVEFNTDAVYHGTNGLMLKTKATDPQAANYAEAWRYVPLAQENYLMFRCKFSLVDVSYVRDFRVSISIHDGSNTRLSIFNIAVDNDDIEIYNDSGSYEVVKSNCLGFDDGPWHLFEGALNLEDWTYHYVQLNNQYVDLSSYGINVGGADIAKHQSISFKVTNETTQRATAYVDDIIVAAVEGI